MTFSLKSRIYKLPSAPRGRVGLSSSCSGIAQAHNKVCGAGPRMPRQELNQGSGAGVKSGQLRNSSSLVTPPLRTATVQRPALSADQNKRAGRPFGKHWPTGEKLAAILRKYPDGIKRFEDGREFCLTEEAWERRKDELHDRSDSMCEMEYWNMRCGSEIGRSEMHPHHIRKRSLRGGDQLGNLLASCETCHLRHHLEGDGK